MNARLAILFAAVAEERSFTRAAARLNIAQPWLSAQVRKFEEQLGFALFDRTKGGIELTTQGEQLLPIALELADAARRLRELSRSVAFDVSLSVRVGAHASSSGVPEFGRLNDDFTVLYRDASLVIEAGITPELVDEVVSGQLDVALVMWPFLDRGLEALLLREVTPYVLVDRNADLAEHDVLAPADLSGQRIGVIRRAEQPQLYDAISAPLTDAGVDLKPVPESGGRAMEHFAKTQGIGVLMVEGDPADFAKDGELVARPLSGVVAARHMLVKRTDNDKRAVGRYWRAAEELTASI